MHDRGSRRDRAQGRQDSAARSDHANSRLVEDLAIDSLDLVSVILQIQDHFGVAIEEDAVPNLCRVADLAAYLSDTKGIALFLTSPSGPSRSLERRSCQRDASMMG